MTSRPETHRRLRRALCAALAHGLIGVLLAAGAGCGLLSSGEPVGFRDYPLRDVTMEEAVDVVRDVTRREATRLFGGITLTWDPEPANLTLDPIYAGSRRMTLYIHLEPRAPDVNLQMFALVETIQEAAQPSWGQPQQDVILEQQFYDAYVAELLARRRQRN